MLESKGNQRETARQKAARLERELDDARQQNKMKDLELAKYEGGMTREDLEALSAVQTALDEGKRQRYERNKLLETTDELTGLPNRRAFMTRAASILQTFYAGKVEHKREISGVCAIGIDIDHFKKVNDTYGHPVGDKVLQRIAEVLKRNLRGNDPLGRMGGEEITVLFMGTREQAVAMAERLREAIKTIRIPEMGDEKITASFGVVEVEPQDHRLTEDEVRKALAIALTHADAALYAAKGDERVGRDRVIVYGSPEFEAYASKMAK